MIGLPDPEMRRFLANGTPELVPHAIYPHQARGLKIVSIDKDTCVVAYTGKELKFPTCQQLKLTIREVNKFLEDNGPKKNEVKV